MGTKLDQLEVILVPASEVSVPLRGGEGNVLPSSTRTKSANCSTVGNWKRIARGSSRPYTFFTRAKTRTAIRECPPSSKKSSFMPIRSIPRNSCHNSTNIDSIESRGGSNVVINSGRTIEESVSDPTRGFETRSRKTGKDREETTAEGSSHAVKI